jgi:3-deoxy-D-manno-octulosonic acid (KDO) 8-phosphate synthase
VTAYTHVDFDEITASSRSRHPLLAIFSGTHDVQVVADATGSNGMTRVNVQSVSLDGVSIPHMALEMFIERWVNPKYPSVKLDGEYKLPAHLDTVRIESRQGVVTQK